VQQQVTVHEVPRLQRAVRAVRVHPRAERDPQEEREQHRAARHPRRQGHDTDDRDPDERLHARYYVSAAPTCPRLIVLDEAYNEYYGESGVELIEDHPNVLVLRSFSKAFSLAGMRCGYVVAQPAVLDILARVLAPWAVSGLTQVAALAAMEDLPYMRATVAECGRSRQSIVDGLQKLGFVVHNTQANFIIWQVRDPAQAVKALVARNVYVSNKDSVPQLKGCLRVTVGNSSQTQQFLGIVQELRGKGLLEP